MKCYCKSNIEFSNCCEPFIKGLQQPASALELMKSRYSAYATSNLEYINKTQIEQFNLDDLIFLKNWSKNSHWQHLEIINYTVDTVEFKAYYIFERTQHLLHENSKFIKIENKWVYENGVANETKPVFGRNENCICGSRKKYKKCCLKELA
jgi:SEC-C motif-containing protein